MLLFQLLLSFSLVFIFIFYLFIIIFFFYHSFNEEACVHPAFPWVYIEKYISLSFSFFFFLFQFSHRRLCLIIIVYCFNSLWKQSPKLKLDTHIKAISFFFFFFNLFYFCTVGSRCRTRLWLHIYVMVDIFWIYMCKKIPSVKVHTTHKMMFVVVLIKTRNVTLNCWM